ncbi:conserved hypothetical protein [Pseudomonas sp. IT-93MI4]
MSWIVNPYFLNLAPLDTLHPTFYRTVELMPSPRLSTVLFYSRRQSGVPRQCFGPVNRSRSCLKSVIRE